MVFSKKIQKASEITYYLFGHACKILIFLFISDLTVFKYVKKLMLFNAFLEIKVLQDVQCFFKNRLSDEEAFKLFFLRIQFTLKTLKMFQKYL